MGGREGGTYLDIAIGELGGEDEGGVGDADAMVGLISFLQPPKNGDCGGHAGLADEDGLEPTLKGGVLLHVLSEGGRKGGMERGSVSMKLLLFVYLPPSPPPSLPPSLPILLQRRRPDTTQLASSQHRLKQISRVHGAVPTTRAQD